MSKPILVVHSVLLFLQTVLAANNLTEFIDPRWIGLGQLVVASAQGSLVFYQRGQENMATRVMQSLPSTPEGP